MLNIIARLITCLLLMVPLLGYSKSLLLQTTTSVYFTGIIQELVTTYQANTGQHIKIVSSGTGQALKNARNGDADMVLVHAPTLEKKFIDQHYGTKRYPIMYNYFIFIGPKEDPAFIKNLTSSTDILLNIKKYGMRDKAIFLSRGDDSGTHFLERSLWERAQQYIDMFSSSWYRESGQGMGTTINIAVASNAYTISDMASWLKYANKQHHKAFLVNDDHLYNLYSIIPVNPARHAHVNYEASLKFIHWLLSDEAQHIIADYTIDSHHLYYTLTP